MQALPAGGESLIGAVETLGGAAAVAAADSGRLLRAGLSAAVAKAISHPNEALIESGLDWLADRA
ncbi:MAG: hypothetical protein PVF89_05955, partial [Lysobacterales bacterium]